MEIKDIIVVGSGCCGSIVAKTFIDNGDKITLLDAGITQEEKYTSEYNSFINIRTNDENQFNFFLGEKFEALKSLYKKNALHLTPNRYFSSKKVSDYLIWANENFNAVESLAKGGLGNAWGLGSYVYSEPELRKTGLPVNEMKEAYKWVSKNIGISGGNDNAKEYSNGNLFEPQKAIPLDFNGEKLWDKLSKKNNLLKSKGFVIGRAPLAICTENNINGEIFKGNDLEFYDGGNASAFRPINLIDKLQKNNLFNYESNQLVISFEEKDDLIIVHTMDLRDHETKIYYCKKLILASGAIGTARIVMRSSNIKQLPILCNPYTYIPSLQPKLIGNCNTVYQTGLAQLSLYYDKDRNHSSVAMGSLYSYRALMNFRIMKEFPIGLKQGREILKLLQPALNITGIFHPEEQGQNKFIELIPDKTIIVGDKLKCNYQLTEKELRKLVATEKSFKKTLRILGSYPLKVQRNKIGASVHYGGTIPFKRENNKTPIHNNDGKLLEYKNIYIADGSGFNFLSGKGLTLTLMAYAHHVTNKIIGK